MKAYLPDGTRLSQVHLRVADAQRALGFYAGLLGLKASPRNEARTALSAGPHRRDMLVLTEARDGAPRLAHFTGMSHLALRYPSRKDLAQATQRIIAAGYPVAGASDHGVSEAVYLNDPEGNGIELYADRPRSQWHWEQEQIQITSAPLELERLVSEASTATKGHRLPELGHIHLQVQNLAAAEQFYSDFLGLTVTQRSCSGALFFATGNYHHQVAVNVCAGPITPPPGAVGLVSYRFDVTCGEILYCLGHRAPLLGYDIRTQSGAAGAPLLQIRDPNGIWLEIQPSHRGPHEHTRLRCPENKHRQLQQTTT